MISNLVNKIKQEIIKEATSNLTGSRGSFVPPLRPGKRIFSKTETAPYNDSLSKY